MRFKKLSLRLKFNFYICHWCKNYTSLRKKWTWKHENQCIDNPKVLIEAKDTHTYIE